jgi:hypothetical protein
MLATYNNMIRGIDSYVEEKEPTKTDGDKMTERKAAIERNSYASCEVFFHISN